MSMLENLNEEQLQTVTTTEGYVRVIAGAGTGKTRALVQRYAYLVNELGISTSNILCCTFTNKAANEMKRRIREIIGDGDTGFICTFHGFCVQLLREDIHAINFPQNFVIMDGEDTETILKSVYESAGILSRKCTFNMAREYISKEKTTEFSHLSYLMDLDNTKLLRDYEQESDILKKIYLGYLYEQKKSFGLDFDDLITIALYILENCGDKRKKWQERMMYVMVDEFQDVSQLNYALADILSGYHKNLFVVGDPDQTIYSWRGADVDYIMKFDERHEGTKTIILDKNYRSSSDILNAANSMIAHNKNRMEKELISMKGENVPVVCHHAKTAKLEAEWIAGRIKGLIQSGRQYNEIAILYRSHFISRNVEEVFIREKIPYVLYSGIEFYKRKEIKDILSYLRFIVYKDDLSLQRIINEPKRNIGKKRMKVLREYAEANQCSLYMALLQNLGEDLFVKSGASDFVSVIEKYSQIYEEMRISDVLTGILQESGYEIMLRQMGEQERLDNLSELKQSIFDYEKLSGEDNTLEEYLQSVALYTNTDKEERKNSVKMMTIHTAKGLEFPNVFLCGFNEGIFPTKHVDTVEKLEEERRLAYVAYTRAEDCLFLSEAEGINYDGSYRYPSRFIFNTDKKYLAYTTPVDEKLFQSAKRYLGIKEAKINPAVPFHVGDRVMHKVFGLGEILAIRTDLSCYTIKFEKYETPRNISFRMTMEKA